ncbi:hypothetical protein ACFO25_07615 [Paenactinomyces guangxiensis]|uniref:Uncharacterized protein n=1 Tax=Paenactinomyces guangxiensis TaxID=1490290 RepID=A0A7W1WNF8_9BACL|nr:hypothetical protein [Paenactinomyces guangxiensis]MBA4493087.1 hypothetical protein [Paenactinomyces guangxiensis]MBH8590063.1 hypothetical protein [Paenactinomyces guangxiensis]
MIWLAIILPAFFFLTILPRVWVYQKHDGGFKALQVLRFIGGIIYGWFVFYVLMADVTWSAYFAYYAWIIFILLLIDSITYDDGSDLTPLTGFVALLGILVYLYMLIVYPFTIKQDKYEFVQAKQTEKMLEPINEQHIPVVPREYARYKMEKVLEKAANYFYYNLGKATIQKINQRLVWIAPIEYKGFFKWLSADTVPGYIMMDAEDQRAEAKLVSHKMKYVNSAYFGENVNRLVRKTYPHYVLMEASFEPDDNGKPYFAVSYGEYNKYRDVRQVKGVILVYPASGNMTKYEMKNIPAFVDQVVPADIAYERNEWFGLYKHGFWNSVLMKQDVHVPTQWEDADEVVAVFDRDLNMHWATDHTRAETDSGSMVGYSLVNSRTGELTYYTGTNGILNGRTAMNVVEKTYREKQWKAASPVLYNIYGQYTWVISALDANGVLRKIALVNARDEKVIGAGDSKQEAFNTYQTAISIELDGDSATPSKDVVLTEKTGIVQAVYKATTTNDTIVQMLLEGNDKIFTLRSSKFPYAVFVEKGHRVKLKYLDTKETIVSVKEFKNETLQK